MLIKLTILLCSLAEHLCVLLVLFLLRLLGRLGHREVVIVVVHNALLLGFRLRLLARISILGCRLRVRLI